MATDPTGGWAKAVEKGSEAATEAVRAGRDIGGFVAPVLGPLIGMLGDQFAVWRTKRQIRLVARYQEFMRDRKLSAATRDIAPAFLLPLIERVSIEDDNNLQDVWAMMLANAADADSGAEMRSPFVSMLAEMTHLDVVILAELDTARSDPELKGFLPTSMLPERLGIMAAVAYQRDRSPSRWPTWAGWAVSTRQPGWEAGSPMGALPDLGNAFIAACTLRQSAADR